MGIETRNIYTDKSKLGTKRHILTEKCIPLSIVTSPTNTHNINLETVMVDKTVAKTAKPSSRSKNKRRQQQHLCLDSGYKSAEEEQKLIKRGYILMYIPIKRKKEKGEDSKKIAI